MATEEIIIKTDKAVKEIDNLTNATQDSTKASKKHQDTLLDTAANVEFMGVSMSSLSKSLGGTIKLIKATVTSLKVFKIALAATGIGLVVIALGALHSFLTRTQKGLDIVTDATAALSAAFGVVLDRLAKLIEGDFIGAFSGIGSAIAFAANEALRFEAIQGDMEERLRGIVVLNAELNTAIAENVLLSRDRTIAEQERLNAIIIAQKQQQIVNDNNIATAQKELDLLDQIQADKKINGELVEADLELRVKAVLEVGKQEKRAADKLRQLTNREFELRAKIDATNRKAAESAHQARIEQQQSEIDLFVTHQAARGEIVKETTALELDFAKSKNTAISLMDERLNVQFKNSSIGQAIINTREAVTQAISQGGIFGLLQVPILLAAGFAQVKAIASSIIPKGIKFGSGGMVSGPSHSTGGVKYGMGGRMAELEGGEAIINKRSVSMFKPQLSAINQAGGGISFQTGGVIPAGINTNIPIQQAPQVIPVLYKDDVDKLNQRVLNRESRATL